MHDTKSVSTYLVSHLGLSKKQSPTIELEYTQMDMTTYAYVVSSLVYINILDITHSGSYE